MSYTFYVISELFDNVNLSNQLKFMEDIIKHFQAQMYATSQCLNHLSAKNKKIYYKKFIAANFELPST